jgi:hypothetical protein
LFEALSRLLQFLLPVGYSKENLHWATQVAQSTQADKKVVSLHVSTHLPAMNPGVLRNNISDETRIRRGRKELSHQLRPLDVRQSLAWSSANRGMRFVGE